MMKGKKKKISPGDNRLCALAGTPHHHPPCTNTEINITKRKAKRRNIGVTIKHGLVRKKARGEEEEKCGHSKRGSGIKGRLAFSPPNRGR